MKPIETARYIAKILDDKKAKEIEVLTVTGVSTLTDYFIICTANSAPHIKAIADEVLEKMQQQGKQPLHTEGYREATWILLDYGDVVVHVFHTEARVFYSLERLWADAPRLDISDVIDNNNLEGITDGE